MVYLDFNASTPLDEVVRSSMVEVDLVAVNPGSVQHRSGTATNELLEHARDTIAQLLQISKQEIIFTSGATEGISVALLGVMAKLPDSRRGMIVAATEHKAVLQSAMNSRDYLGGELHVLPVDRSGHVDLGELENLLATLKFGLVSVMSANNETGVIQDTQAIAEVVHRFGALYFCDLTQSVGKEEIVPKLAYVDLAVLSGHKIYGPKGCGLLFATRDAQSAIAPLLCGGGQERGLRGGTPNTAGIVGLAEALTSATRDLAAVTRHFELLVSEFRTGLNAHGIDFQEIGAEHPRIPNTLNVRFTGFDADALMANMPNVEVSTGSACNSAVVEPSHVLLAHGLSVEEASQCIRFSFGKPTTIPEIHFAIEEIAKAMKRIQQIEMAG